LRLVPGDGVEVAAREERGEPVEEVLPAVAAADRVFRAQARVLK
jgi:hypothetical protein